MQQGCDPPLWSGVSQLTTDPVRQAWPSCLVIHSEDSYSAYQSAWPADYLSKREETDAVNTETVGSGFFTGASMAACSIKRKIKFQSGERSVVYTVLIMQSTTS